jgi:hypothetical protein
MRIAPTHRPRELVSDTIRTAVHQRQVRSNRRLDHVVRRTGGGPQVARNLEISESCLRRWTAQNAVDAGVAEGLTSVEKRELVEAAAQEQGCVARARGLLPAT